MNKEPEIKLWHGMKLAKISDVGDEFKEWLYGQTLPLVEDDPEPMNWAYYWDYERFINGLPIID